MKLPGFVSKALTLRETAAVVFALVAFLPLLLFVGFLSVSNLLSRTEAQFAAFMALTTACLGFMLFRHLTARVLKEQQASTQQLEDLVLKQTTLNELVEMSARIPKIQDLLASVLETTMRAVHSNIGSIMLLDQQRKTLRIAAARGLPHEVHEQAEVRLGEGVAGKVAELGDAVIVDDIETDARFARANDPKYGTGSFICMPVRVGERVIGVINLAKKEDARTSPPTPRPFSPTDLQFLSALLSFIGYAVDNARLLQEAQESATQLQNVVDDLRATQARLVRGETLAAIGKLASGMAHHLNNLFAVILGRLELLLAQMPETDPEARRYLDIVQRAAQDGAEVVRRVQRFSRVQPVSRTMPVDLNQLAQEALDLTRPRWHNEALLHQIRIDTALDLGAIEPVAGEPAPLREVLMNVVLNAIDAMPDGGRLGVKTWADAQGAHCDVSDTGVGMSEEVRERALNPFFTTKGPKSTGLGLSAAYGIVQRHNGRLEIDSVPGRGTTVHITLPQTGPVTGAAASARTGPAKPAQLRVMLVDDEPEVRTALADILETAGHTAYQSAGGQEALAWLEAGHVVDLVLTDLGMLGITGTDLAREIRARWPHLRVGLMTGWDQTEAPVSEANPIVDFVLAKPFGISALLDAYARGPRTPA